MKLRALFISLLATSAVLAGDYTKWMTDGGTTGSSDDSYPVSRWMQDGGARFEGDQTPSPGSDEELYRATKWMQDGGPRHRPATQTRTVVTIRMPESARLFVGRQEIKGGEIRRFSVLIPSNQSTILQIRDQGKRLNIPVRACRSRSLGVQSDESGPSVYYDRQL